MYVPIGAGVIADTKRKIRNLQNAEMQSLPDPTLVKTRLVTDPLLLTLIMDKLWRKLADLRERLDVPEYRHPRQVEVGVRYHTSETEPGSGLPYKLSTFTANSLDVPCFHGISRERYDFPRIKVKFDTTEHPDFPELVAAEIARFECIERWDAVNKEIVAFLGKCKSANEAVKLYPEIVRYMPEDTMAKINKKTARGERTESEAAAMLKGLNKDNINVSTVLARMAGAKV